MASNRLERIKEEVKRELSGIIRRLKDPRYFLFQRTREYSFLLAVL